MKLTRFVMLVLFKDISDVSIGAIIGFIKFSFNHFKKKYPHLLQHSLGWWAWSPPPTAFLSSTSNPRSTPSDDLEDGT